MTASSPLLAMLLGAGIPAPAGSDGASAAGEDARGLEALFAGLLSKAQGETAPAESETREAVAAPPGDNAQAPSPGAQSIIASLIAALAPPPDATPTTSTPEPEQSPSASAPASAMDAFLALGEKLQSLTGASAGASAADRQAPAEGVSAAPAAEPGEGELTTAPGLSPKTEALKSAEVLRGREAAKAFATLSTPLEASSALAAEPAAARTSQTGVEQDMQSPVERTPLEIAPPSKPASDVAVAEARPPGTAQVQATQVQSQPPQAQAIASIATSLDEPMIEPPPAAQAADDHVAQADVAQDRAPEQPGAVIPSAVQRTARSDPRIAQAGPVTDLMTAPSPAETETARAVQAAPSSAPADDDAGEGFSDPQAKATPASQTAADAADSSGQPTIAPFGQVMAFANQVKAAAHTVTHLAAQIVSKATGAKATQFDVALDPAGLGRVDVQLRIDAAGQLTAALSFDNPQAAAELRARAGELQRALSAAGFDIPDSALSFDLASGSGDQGRQAAWDLTELGGRTFRAMALAADEAGPTAAAISAALRQAAGGLDIRI